MTSPAANVAAPPRRRRRWWLRIAIALLAFIAVLLVLTQIFLWTDYPRQIAQAQVERILRVRTSIRSVSIGWLGQTRIEGVTLTLPFESEPFLKVATIDVKHTSLPLIAFSQDVESINVDGVEVIARQTADGRWDVEQLRSPPSTTTQPAQTTRRTSSRLADIPSFRATNVRASLIRTDGRRLDLTRIEGQFQKRDALTARLTAHAGDVLSIDGELGQSATLPQSLKVHFSGLPRETADFFGVGVSGPMSADAEWTGRLTADGIAGSLRISGARADRLHVAGTVEINAGDVVLVRPTDLSLRLDDGAALSVRATGGSIAYDGGLRARGVVGTLNGGRFVLDGTFDPKLLAADLAAQWEEVTRKTLATSGSARLRTERLFNGKIRIALDAKGGATVPAGEAMGALAVHGDADSLQAFTAALKLEPFTWTPADGSSPIVTPPLDGQLIGEGKSIRIEAAGEHNESVGLLTAYAGIDRSTFAWWVNLDASRLTLPAIAARGIEGPVDVSIAADGTMRLIHVAGAYAKVDRGIAYVIGDYNFDLPRPVSATAWAWYDRPVTEDESAQLNSLRAEAKIDGTIAPLDLAGDVKLNGSELVFEGRPIGDVALRLDATVDENEATMRSQEMEALGGRGSLRGRWSRKERGPPTIVAKFRDMPAKNIGVVFGRDDFGGTIQNGSAILRVPSTRLDRIEMTATARGADLSVGPFRAEAMLLEATLHAGRFEVRPELHEDGGKLAATFTGDVDFAAPIRVDAMLNDWPAPYLVSNAPGAERFRPRASGHAGAAFSVRTGDLSGDVSLGGVVERGDSKLADFHVDGTLKNKLVTISKATLDTLDGHLATTASFDLANYNATTIDAIFQNLTPARLSWFNPIAAEVTGKLSGTFAVRPSTKPRALGPLEVALAVQPDGVTFRNVAIGPLDTLAYADVKSPNEFRVVTDHVKLAVAGGEIEPFARLTSEPVRGLAQLVTAQFKNLDLGQITKAVDDDGKDLVGKLAGHVQLYGQTTRLATLNGDATIDITESDLVNFGPISALYSVLSIGTAGSKPIGSGTVSLRFGGDVLTIDDASYFNRGVYANAFGPLRGLSKGTEAEVDHAIVVGSLQPLRAVELPFFGDVNDTLAALQSSLTAIEVTGTAKDPKMRQVSIGAIGDAFQKLLLGKARGEGK